LNFTVPLALFGWPLVTLALCRFLPPRRAVIAAYVAAWLFLPVYEYSVPGLVDWAKMSATSISLVAGLLILDFGRISAFRPRWLDAPMAAWCLCPLASSLSNGLGAYDGLSMCLNQFVVWGLPYLLGRLYLGDLDGLRDLALGLFIGGLIYIPLCLYEIRMSPQLHGMIYGFHQHSFDQTRRYGGWRPTVFMDHGLMVAMWMSMASLVGIWLWFTGRLRSYRGISILWFLIPLVITTVLCKSAGALLLLLIGILWLAWTRRFRTRAPLYLLSAIAPLYILVRGAGIWPGDELVEAVRVVSEERAASLATRFHQENLLAEKAMKQPVFGWGGWGRSRITDDSGRDISITDGLWIIEFGQRGLVGILAMLGVFLMPVIALVRRIPVREWGLGRGIHAAALAMVVVLFLIDCLPNAHITPIYVLAAGGLTGLLAWRLPIYEPVTEVEMGGT
jgi:hypothetical protein